MEQLTYRFSLDTHKNGVQRTLQGFETGDNISRKLVISLVEGDQDYNLPLDNIVAVMYVKRPSQTTPSINECLIDGNTIVYDVAAADLQEQGIVEMQLKVIYGTVASPIRVLISPRFSIEVWDSIAAAPDPTDDPTYTALEAALVKAQMCYDARITSFSFDEYGTLTVVYGYDEQTQTHVTYTTDIFKDAIDDLKNHYPTITIGSVTSGSVPSVINSGTSQHAIFDFVLVKGDKGDDGADGKDGKDGQDGADGADGADGFSPIANVTKSGSVATITITDKVGTTTAQVSDGTSGDTVSWNQITQSGTKIATVNISGTSYDVYAPTSGGGGGATSFAGLDDVSLSSLQDGQVPIYNSITQKWSNGTIPAQAWADILNKPFSSIGANLSVSNGVLNATDTTYSVVTKSANGLVPQLPNETTTKKFLRQDGTWAEPTGGHTIKNPSGTSMTQRDNLQFVGSIVTVTDDSSNNTTKVTITGGGGGLLPHLIVITEEDATVTAVKGATTINLVETSTEHYEADLTDYGTWTIHSVLSGDDATTSLVVDACKIYTVDDAHFSASITVYYPDGGTCSCSMTGEQTLYANTCPYTFTVHKAGTWTISTTEYGETFTEDVVITTDGQSETVSLPDGSVITPTDDVPALLACAGIGDSPDTTLADLLADDETLLKVLTTDNAIDYLVRSTTFASDIAADEDAMAMIGSYDYASDTLRGNSTWKTAIVGSTYASNVLNVSVPIMTSNTTPSGEVSATSILNSNYAYFAFDKDVNTAWISAVSANSTQSVTYKFPRSIVPEKLYISLALSSRGSNYSISASNDNSTWTELQAVSPSGDTYEMYYDMPNNTTAYQYFKGSYKQGSQGAVVFYDLNFFARETGGVQSWLKAGGITDKSYTTLAEVLADTTTLSALISNHDAVDYLVTAKALIDGIVADATAMSYIGLNNYCANSLLADAEWCEAIANSTYKESVLNVKVPTMTSATTPSGEVVESGHYSTNEGYLAFDNNDNSFWSGAEYVENSWVGYHFTSNIMVYACVLSKYRRPTSVKVEASSNGTDWSAISESTATGVTSDTTVSTPITIICSPSTAQGYVRLYCVSTYNHYEPNIYTVQFYGRVDV